LLLPAVAVASLVVAAASPVWLRPGLLLPGVSLFGAYEFGAPEMTTLRVRALTAMYSQCHRYVQP